MLWIPSSRAVPDDFHGRGEVNRLVGGRCVPGDMVKGESRRKEDEGEGDPRLEPLLPTRQKALLGPIHPAHANFGLT